MNKFLKALTLVTGTALASTLALTTPAQAITFNFNWNGNQGYSAQGSFSYDETTAPVTFSETGAGTTDVLDSLDVSFFTPDNNLIATYDNVTEGNSTGNYFAFNFDTVASEVFGLIDVGGEVPGDTYLSGTVNTNLSLYQVPEASPDVVVDSNLGTITVEAVPEASSILGILVFGVIGIALRLK